MFYDGVRYNDLVKRDHLLNNLYGRCDVGSFEICFHEGYLWRGHKAVISFIPHRNICPFN